MADLAVSLTVEQLKALMEEAATKAVMRSTSAQPNEVLTIKEAGELLRMHPNVLAKKVEELGIPAHRISREWRFRRSELLEWLSKQSAA